MRHALSIVVLAGLQILSGPGMSFGQTNENRAREAKSTAGEAGAKRRVEIAREAFDSLHEDTIRAIRDPNGPGAESILDAHKAEDFYIWSRRWMESELATSLDKPAEAIRGHLKRMKDLEGGGIVKKLSLGLQTDFVTGAVVVAPVTDEVAAKTMVQMFARFTKSMEFFRLEAESDLAKASKP